MISQNMLIAGGVILLLLLIGGFSPAAEFVGYTTVTITDACTGKPVSVYVYGCRSPTCSSFTGGNLQQSPFQLHVSNLNEYYLFCDKPKGYEDARCARLNHEGTAPTSFISSIAPAEGCGVPEPGSGPEPEPEPEPESQQFNIVAFIQSIINNIIGFFGGLFK